MALNKLFPNDTMAERYTVRRNDPEYDREVCQTECNNITFWTSDIHWGTRLDQPTFLGDLGQRVLIAIAKKKGYRNPFVWKMNGIHLYRRISEVIATYFGKIWHQNHRVTEKMTLDSIRMTQKLPQ